jgi:hypothetical protein
MRFFLALLPLVYIFSCTTNSDAINDKIPENVIDSVTFAKVLADMHVADAAAKFQVLPDNRVLTAKYGENLGVLKNYKIDKAKFDSSMVYYSAHPDLLDRVYSKVLEILSEKQALLNAKGVKAGTDTEPRK